MAQMSRTLPLLPPSIALAAALLLIHPFDVSLARDMQAADVPQIGQQIGPHAGESAPAARIGFRVGSKRSAPNARRCRNNVGRSTRHDVGPSIPSAPHSRRRAKTRFSADDRSGAT